MVDRIRRKRCIILRTHHEDMHRYCGRPQIHEVSYKGQQVELWVKPAMYNNNWFAGAIGRHATFGIQALPGLWDGQEFTEDWPKEAKAAARKYWPYKWQVDRLHKLHLQPKRDDHFSYSSEEGK